MDSWGIVCFFITLGIPGLLWWIDKLDKKEGLGRYENKLKNKSDINIIDDINNWTNRR